jgi:hypothetical protein
MYKELLNKVHQSVQVIKYSNASLKSVEISTGNLCSY